jgi:hypothetical protein
LKSIDDMHRQGVFAVVGPDDRPVMDTFDTTGYAARATFIREHHMIWSRAEKEGYYVAEFAAVARSVPRAQPPECNLDSSR